MKRTASGKVNFIHIIIEMKHVKRFYTHWEEGEKTRPKHFEQCASIDFAAVMNTKQENDGNE